MDLIKMLGLGAVGAGLGKKAYDKWQDSDSSRYEEYVNAGKKAALEQPIENRAQMYQDVLTGVENDLYAGDMNNEGNANVSHTLKRMGATPEEVDAIIRSRAQGKQIPMFGTKVQY